MPTLEANPLKRHETDASTAEVGLGRIGTPQDVGSLAVFLASDDAAWITGEIFRIDGGAW